jgi:hypothetical protein
MTMTQFNWFYRRYKVSMAMGTVPPDVVPGTVPVLPMAGMHPAVAAAKAGMFPRQRRAELEAVMTMEEEDREARIIAAAEEMAEEERKEKAIAMQKAIADAEQQARIEAANEAVTQRTLERALSSMGPEKSAKIVQEKMVRILSGG